MSRSITQRLQANLLTWAQAEMVMGDAPKAHVELAIAAYRGREWERLAYPDWVTYIEQEWPVIPKLKVPLRRKAVAAMRANQMSLDSIAAALGCAQGTVSSDLSQLIRTDEFEDCGSVGLDGKKRPARKPRPEPEKAQAWQPSDTLTDAELSAFPNEDIEINGRVAKYFRRMDDIALSAEDRLPAPVADAARRLVDDLRDVLVSTDRRRPYLRALDAVAELLTALQAEHTH